MKEKPKWRDREEEKEILGKKSMKKTENTLKRGKEKNPQEDIPETKRIIN